MQANNSPRFLKNFMIGLVASSAGAFIALPGSAMPEPTETGTEIEAIEAIEAVETLDTVEAAPSPDATDALPEEGAAALETEPVAEDSMEMDAVVEEPEVTEEEAVAEETEITEEAAPVADETEEIEEPIADDAMEEEPIADDAEAMEEPVADETEAMEEEPIADDAMMEEEPIADETEAMEEEPVADDAIMEEEPIADDAEAMEEPVADETEAMEEEPIADETEAMEEEPIAEEAEAVEKEPVAEEPAEELDTAAFTIAELTDNSESFEILAAALAAADLIEILGSEGPFTVFAPTDDAFAALPEGAVDQLLMPENKDVLVQVLTYHVVPGALLSTELETGSVATVEGSEVALDVADTVTVNNANVVVADVEASNGVIHIIDRVIIPPSPEADADAEVEAGEAE